MNPLSTQNVRVSKKLLAALPANVARQLKAVADDYGIASVTVKAVAPDYTVYAAEGARYWLIVGEQEAHAEIVSEHALGASGVSHQIGRRIEMPVGAFLIEVSYYTRYWLTLYNVQPSAVAEGGAS